MVKYAVKTEEEHKRRQRYLRMFENSAQALGYAGVFNDANDLLVKLRQVRQGCLDNNKIDDTGFVRDTLDHVDHLIEQIENFIRSSGGTIAK